MEQNVLNSISAPVQEEDEREMNRFFGSSSIGSEEEDGILKFSANEILSNLCGNGKNALKNDDDNTSQ